MIRGGRLRRHLWPVFGEIGTAMTAIFNKSALITLGLAALLLIACRQDTLAPLPDIPATVEAQVQEALAAVPTPAPLPTYTPYPPLISAPTYTPYPTPTPVPATIRYLTPRPAPTYTPYPTLALAPTYTPFPTLVPLPTYTPYPTRYRRRRRRQLLRLRQPRSRRPRRSRCRRWRKCGSSCWA